MWCLYNSFIPLLLMVYVWEQEILSLLLLYLSFVSPVTRIGICPWPPPRHQLPPAHRDIREGQGQQGVPARPPQGRRPHWRPQFFGQRRGSTEGGWGLRWWCWGAKGGGKLWGSKGVEWSCKRRRRSVGGIVKISQWQIYKEWRDLLLIRIDDKRNCCRERRKDSVITKIPLDSPLSNQTKYREWKQTHILEYPILVFKYSDLTFTIHIFQMDFVSISNRKLNYLWQRVVTGLLVI